MTRKEALATGSLTYDGHSACPKCGGQERYAKYGVCVACAKAASRRWFALNRDRALRTRRDWHMRHMLVDGRYVALEA